MRTANTAFFISNAVASLSTTLIGSRGFGTRFFDALKACDGVFALSGEIFEEDTGAFALCFRVGENTVIAITITEKVTPERNFKSGKVSGRVINAVKNLDLKI